MSLCSECKRRSICTELCNEAEIYVNQDFVKLRELPIGVPKYIVPDKVDLEDEINRRILDKFEADLAKLPRQEQVDTLLKMGLKRKDVAQLLGITMGNVRKIVQRHKRRVTLLVKGEKQRPFTEER